MFGLLLTTATLVAQQPAFQVIHYDIALDLPRSGKTIEGVTSLTVHRLAPVDTLVLDLLDMKVNLVTEAGKRIGFSQHDGRLNIYVGGSRQDTLHVTITYAGVPTDGLIISTDSAGRWLAFGDNWPNRARHWIPSVDHPSSKATVMWTVRAPAGRRIVANGELISEREVPRPADPDGAFGSPSARTETVWRESRPIPMDVMVIAAAPLERYDLGNTACGFAELGRCVPQMVYTAPEQRAILPGVFAETDSIVTFFARIVGPFPYEKLAHLQSSTIFGGMENASAIFYADKMFRRDSVQYDIVAHETAHQWFGDAVTEREWSHLWLSEGFATYFAALYTQHSRGDSAFRVAMAKVRETVLKAEEVTRRPVIDTIETKLTSLLNANSYDKGGFVLHMLREELGDSTFFRGVRRYVREHRHGTALTDDLEQALERESGRTLKPIFDQWLRRPGYPEIAVTWTSDATAKELLLTVTQSERFGFFAFPLTVEYSDAAGPHRIRLAESAEHTHTFRVHTANGPVTAIRVDPDVTLLARIAR